MLHNHHGSQTILRESLVNNEERQIRVVLPKSGNPKILGQFQEPKTDILELLILADILDR